MVIVKGLIPRTELENCMEAKAFINAVPEDKEPIISGNDGLMLVYIAKAAEK